MNNYKIDDNVTAEVMSSYELHHCEESLQVVVDKIMNLIVSIGLQPVASGERVLKFVKSNECCKLDNLVIREANAFDKDKIYSFENLDKEFSAQKLENEFRLKSLQLHRAKALQDFNISLVVLLNDQLSQITMLLSQIDSSITELNSKIAITEEEYCKNLANCREEYLKAPKLIRGDKLMGIYDENIVDGLRVALLVEGLINIANEYGEDIGKLLSNEKVMSCLGPMAETVKGEMGKNVAGNI